MDNKVNRTNWSCLPLYILCGICFICNIYGLINMFMVETKIRFEKYVLMSGIIEIALISLFAAKIHKEIILDIVQTLQTFITLYISRKFLAFYLTLYSNIENSLLNQNEEDNNDNDNDDKTKNYGKHIYNAYFWIFTIISIIFLTVLILIDIFIDEEDNLIDSIIDLVNDIISWILSIFLLLFSLMVKKIIDIKTYEIIKINNKNNDIMTKNEKYLSTRKLQIIIIAYGFFTTDLIEVILSLIKEIYYRKEIKYRKEENKVYIIDLLVLYSLWLNTFLNFISFYFIVRDSFHLDYTHVKKNKKNVLYMTKTLIEKDTLAKNDNKDIAKFLSEDSHIEQKKTTNTDEFFNTNEI